MFLSIHFQPVAGKKGKMMERRILKDFQIGIVETIVSEAVQGSKDARDVFSSIAKAMKKTSSSKKIKYSQSNTWSIVAFSINIIHILIITVKRRIGMRWFERIRLHGIRLALLETQ